MIVPENRVAMAPCDLEESMNSAIIHRFHESKASCAQNQPLSSVTYAHVNFMFFNAEFLVVVDLPWNTRVLLGLFSWGIAGMVESQIRERAKCSSTVDGSEATKVDRMGRASGERKIGFDTRNRLVSCLSQKRAPGASGSEGRDAWSDSRNHAPPIQPWIAW